jgi:hypothetical protein
MQAVLQLGHSRYPRFLISLNTALFHPLYINIVIAELPKEGSSDADIEPWTPEFRAL